MVEMSFWVARASQYNQNVHLHYPFILRKCFIMVRVVVDPEINPGPLGAKPEYTLVGY